MEDLNAILLKLLLALVTAPAWWPVLRVVWEEFNHAMADEGGVLGRLPTAREAERIRRERASEGNRLVHEPWPTREERISGRRRFPAGRRSAPPPSPPRRSRGFR